MDLNTVLGLIEIFVSGFPVSAGVRQDCMWLLMRLYIRFDWILKHYLNKNGIDIRLNCNKWDAASVFLQKQLYIDL